MVVFFPKDQDRSFRVFLSLVRPTPRLLFPITLRDTLSLFPPYIIHSSIPRQHASKETTDQERQEEGSKGCRRQNLWHEEQEQIGKGSALHSTTAESG